MENDRSYLEMKGVYKGFPGVQALDDVSFNLNKGEVHALVGENGAGKTTLMKILSGAYQPDGGKIFIKGEKLHIDNPKKAQDLGISIVHQELNLFPNLTITENIFGGKMPVKRITGFENREEANITASKYLEKFQLPIPPETLVQNLSIAQQQVVEISKAIAQKASILILDEPTSALTDHESELLFQIIAQLKSDGLGIIYISHRLEEIFAIADRVTILRDGRCVGTKSITDTSMDQVINKMVGRDIEDIFSGKVTNLGEPVLAVEGLTNDQNFYDISFSVAAGEIVGLSGLIGAGRSEVGLAIFGALPYTSGSIKINSQEVDIKNPEQAMAKGVAYLSEDRQKDGLFLNMVVRENVSVSHLDNFTRFGMINKQKESIAAKAIVDQLRIQTPGVEQKVLNLSGGNQQKVVLGRWLEIKPRILIVDEPTRGIDVGAKLEIYNLLQSLAEQGVAILLISSEMPEILGMSDRILVMHEGKLTGTLGSKEATEEKIMALASNQSLN